MFCIPYNTALAHNMPQHTSTILSRLPDIIIWFFLVYLRLWIAHKYLTSNNSHTRYERYYYADNEYRKIIHLTKFPRERILGTHNPTNSACCLLRSLSPANHKVTLKTKLKNAATRKQLRLLIILSFY